MEIESIPPEYYKLDKFTFENNQTLENQTVEYLTFGTPKYNDNDEIINAIIYFHGTTGSFSSIKRISKAIGKNLPFDPDNFFFVSLSTLGTPDSSSPSTSELYDKYPEYTILDMVNFNKLFLEKKFNIKHPLGLIGNSMGGFEAVTWAAYYPDDISFLISLVSSYKVCGQNYIIGKVMNDIIESDKDLKDPEKLLQLSSKAMYSFGLSRKYYMDLSKDEINNYMDEFALEDSQENIYDAYYRNKASINYDLTDKVSDILVPTLIIAIYEDQYFPPELDAIPMNALINNSKLICFNSYLGHIGSSQLDKINDELEDFMKEFK